MSVIDKNGATITQQINYTYDAQGRRVKRVLDPDGAAIAQPLQTDCFIYDGDQLSMTFTATGSASPVLEHRYLYGPADQVVTDEVFNAAGQSTETLWLLGDQQGTVRDIVNDSGVLRKHVDYDPFGRVTSDQTFGAAVDQLFYYTGQERDEANGLQLHGARWYNPSTGRWLSEETTCLYLSSASIRTTSQDVSSRVKRKRPTANPPGQSPILGQCRARSIEQGAWRQAIAGSRLSTLHSFSSAVAKNNR